MFLHPDEILGKLSIPTGAKVADFGTGAGVYALSIARRLGPETTVYAFDMYEPLVEAVGKEGRRTGARFYALHSDLNQHIPLKENLLHVAIVANLLHALTERKRFAEELSRVMSPGGRVLVTDWADSFKNMGPTRDAAVTPAEAVRIFEDVGFNAGEMLPAGTHHYAFIATLPRTAS